MRVGDIVRATAVGVGVPALLVVLVLNVRGQPAHYEAIREKVRRLETLEDVLLQDVLRAHFDLVKGWAPLDGTLADLIATQNALAPEVGGEVDPELHRAFDTTVATIGEERSLVARWKAADVAMDAALAALATAADDSLTADTPDRARLEALIRSVLFRMAASIEQGSRPSLLLAALEREHPPGVRRDSVARVMAAARSTLAAWDDLGATITGLLAANGRDHMGALQTAFREHEAARERAAVISRAVLSVLSLGMGAVVTDAFFRLRRNRRLLTDALARLREEHAAGERHERELETLSRVLDERVNERTAALATANTELQRLVVAKNEFLANVSHDLRTPLASVLGYADLLLDDESSPDERRDCLQTIRRKGVQLLGLVNDILDLSNFEAGQLRAVWQPCAPSELVRQVVEGMRAEAGERSLALSFSSDAAVPASLLTDPARLRQILGNLVGNALKFTERGEVRVVVGDPAGEASSFCVSVIDTGIGMTPAQIGGLFQPFAPVDSSTTRRFSGTGLGLAIAQRLAGLLGGRISVESAIGYGSTFTLRLPLDPTTEGATR